MQLPFTTSEFIHVFETYNAATWPAPLLAYALAAGAIVLAFRQTRFGSQFISLVLASCWAFTGIAYHLVHFSAINPVARVFGIAFVAEAGLLAWSGLRSQLRFRYARDTRSRVGVALIAWSMVGYPLAGALIGHGYPQGPAFGLTPCPLLIFTFGMLLLAERVPFKLIPVPMMWAVVGTSAAFALGIREDLTLALSAITFLALRLRAGSAQRSIGAPRLGLRSLKPSFPGRRGKEVAEG